MQSPSLCPAFVFSLLDIKHKALILASAIPSPFIPVFKINNARTGEMAQQVRALAALPKDMDLVLGTHPPTWQHSGTKESGALFGLFRHCMYMVHIWISRHI